jgi:5-methylcytosine-specific restriction endonuclease McrA
MLTKHCIKCHQLLPATLEYFHANPKSPDGLRHHCRKCKALYDQQRYLARREQTLARAKAWYQNNQTQKAFYDLNYRLKHSTQIRGKKAAYNRQLRVKHPFKVIALRMNHRNREFAPNKRYRISERDIRRLVARFNFSCAKCGVRFSNVDQLEIDHVIPKKRGGVNGIGNYLPLCRLCNREKSYRLWVEYRLNKIVPYRTIA